MAKPLSLEKILFSQGFGTRRYCADLVWAELVKVNGVIAEDPNQAIDTQNLILEVDGQTWPYHEKAYIAFHKPTDCECSHKASHHPSIYSLLPEPLVERKVQCVGRLDHDTTGLILMSDDGQFIHQMTSPKKNIGKTYDIGTAMPIDQKQIDQLLQGVMLHDEPKVLQAKSCELISEHALRMTITEGKYHQVKRMLAAVGNHVNTLHRSSIGFYQLPSNLNPGQWVWLSANDIDQLFERAT